MLTAETFVLALAKWSALMDILTEHIVEQYPIISPLR